MTPRFPRPLLIGSALATVALAGLDAGVAGWEFNGIESPIILSPAGVAALLAGPVLALGWQTRRWVARLQVVNKVDSLAS
jgi:hypothetical protein